MPAFYKAYKQRQKIKDEEMWIMGQYIMSALDSTVCNNFLWKGKHFTPSKYIEKPILQQFEEKSKTLTKEDKEIQLEKFVMSLKIMESNFKAEHTNKDSSVS